MGDRHSSASGGGRPRVVVVTGASAGVGRATAKAFATKGASLVLLARDESRLESAREEVRAAGGDAVSVATDVADPGGVEMAAQAAEAREGNLFEPVRGDYSARGRFSERVKRRSWQFWLRRRWF